MSAKKKHDFESQLARLKEIVDALESAELPLEKGVALYKEGVALSRGCREQLTTARNEIEVLEDGRGGPVEDAADEPVLLADAGAAHTDDLDDLDHDNDDGVF